MNRSSFLILIWIAAAILLPIARWCGFVHWPWWIWAAPAIGLHVMATVAIVGAGILDHAIEQWNDR